MNTYRITVLVKTIEEYEVRAENPEEAEEKWPEARLVRVDDHIENEIWSVREAQRATHQRKEPAD